MSAEALLTSIEKLYKLHKSLYEISIKKTEVLKIGDMEALGQILKEEQSHIAAITKIENERQLAAKAIVPDIEEPSVTDCENNLAGSTKTKLIELREGLSELLGKLKNQNHLNQQLVYQSLQVVNVSLNLLRPQPASINYTPPKNNTNHKPNNGMFNSKV